jgi:hypothetical protein
MSQQQYKITPPSALSTPEAHARHVGGAADASDSSQALQLCNDVQEGLLILVGSQLLLLSLLCLLLQLACSTSSSSSSKGSEQANYIHNHMHNKQT